VPDPEIRVWVDLAEEPDPADPEGWEQVTDRLSYGAGGREVTVTVGRQDESAEIRPTEMGFALRNHDGRFTPNNPASDLAGRWEQGRRVDIAEVLDGAEYALGSGFLSMPEMRVVDPRTSQPVTVTTVDWMGRLETVPPFEGTLAEWVRNEGGPLALWIPLTDTYPHMSYDTTTLLARTVTGFFDVPVPAEPEDLIRAQGEEGPPGDDQSYARWEPVPDAEGDAYIGRAHLNGTIAVPVTTADTVAVSVWLRPSSSETPTVRPDATVLMVGNTTTMAITLLDLKAGLRATVASNLGSVNLDAGRELERDAWRLVTVRADLAAGTCDLWVGGDLAVSGTWTPPSGDGIWDRIRLGDLYAGAIGHVQVRVGPEVMSHDDHLAQYRHGYRGLDRQTVAERIHTLARWAGVPEADVAVPDTCSAPMPVARLAGQSPAAAIRAAGEAGQDWVLTDRWGRITAVPRAQRYNQQPALQIPWGWIRRGTMRMRPDPPVTDVVVTRTGGGSARRADPAAARRHGVKGLRYELDTAVPEDAANLAAWALRAHSVPRTRSPGFVINMLSRSVEERAALLSLRVGDRIEITGMPDGSPADLPHLIVQGIKHTIGPGRVRTMEVVTSPLLGPAPGEPPPCPMVGDLCGPDAVIAY